MSASATEPEILGELPAHVYVSERPLWAYVSLKIVRAGMSQSSKDEIWVNTGFPLGLESLTGCSSSVD